MKDQKMKDEKMKDEKYRLRFRTVHRPLPTAH